GMGDDLDYGERMTDKIQWYRSRGYKLINEAGRLIVSYFENEGSFTLAVQEAINYILNHRVIPESSGIALTSHSDNRLKKFIGLWQVSGTIVSEESGLEVLISGIEKYEWVAGGSFVQHNIELMIGEAAEQSTEIIGKDATNENYFLRYFDSGGRSGLMTA